MLQRRPKHGGGSRVLAALGWLLAAAAIVGSPAAAQLAVPPAPDPSPPPGEAVRQVAAPVQPVLQAPLPDPLEEIVQESPVAPVRDALRDVASNPAGQPPAPASSAASPQPGGSIQPAPSGSQSLTGGGDARSDRSERGSDRSERGGHRSAALDRPADDRASVAGTGASPEDTSAARGTGGVGQAASAEDDERGALARTVERIVEVVPGYLWAVLGALALLALAFAVRSWIDRRRTRALQGERERLLLDMGLLERVLLPQVPERLGDLAASVAYRPAAGPAAGGDFYDVFELPGGRVALVVGDVSGHGRDALERTSSLRPALRGHLEAGLSPRAALEAANRSAGIDASGGFTTAVAAVHDPGSGRLTYAAAGHPPPVLVGAGAHEPLTVSSAPPLGVGLRTGLRQTTVPLPRGSAACFVTDGLLEARRDGELLGRQWLTPRLEAFGPLDSASVLLDRVVEFADEAPDDMTACLVRAVAGPVTVGPRVEELELEPDDVGAAAPEQFLEACGVSDDAVAPALAEARRLAVQTGKALLTVTIDGGGASVRVTSPTREALATT